MPTLKTFKDRENCTHSIDTDKICDKCGQSLYYEVKLGVGLTDTLKAIAYAIKDKGLNVINVKKELYDLNKITLTQYNNMTHLSRLGLIANLDNEVGNYFLTKKAVNFLRGEAIPRGALVSKSNIDRHSATIFVTEETTTIKEIYKNGGYWEIPGFNIIDSRVITDKREQTSLFSFI